jgi:riboflavin synthase
MFTGIVEELGSVVEAGSGRLSIRCRAVTADSTIGSSIAVNGVCLTVVERDPDCLRFDVSIETMRRSALGRLEPGSTVNLERPVTLMTRLGGHLVQGHVDGVGEIVSFEPKGDGARVAFRIPGELAAFVVEKGSIAVDGVSLTAASVDGDRIDVALIPHTLAATTLGSATVGDRVNVEVDLMAKYVERLLGPAGARGPSEGRERTGARDG